MPLSQLKLAFELAKIPASSTEPDAINQLSNAWLNYFADATAVVPATRFALQTAQDAMKAAMIGLSVLNAGPAKIQAGITAFWEIVAISAPAIWVNTPPFIGATPPLGLSTIASSLVTVFRGNTTGGLSLSAAAQAVAITLHPIGGLGGTAIILTPPGGAVPIL